VRILFTTLPFNDLGLLTRSLPVARDLATRGHATAFASPGAAPKIMIAEAGFVNLPLELPVPAWRRERPGPTGEIWNGDHSYAFLWFMDERHV
jgi:hypothetical protein